MKLLIIRPQPGADASAARARAAGFDPVVIPFFEVRSRQWQVPDVEKFDALLITSANSVRHAGSGLETFKKLPVHAVGSNSAEAAKQAGLTLASTGNEGVDAAIETARSAGHHRLLWLAGEDRTLVQMPADVSVETATVYASEHLELPERALGEIALCPLVALHSARAAAGFAKFVDRAGLPRERFVLAAFSPAIAVAAGEGWRGIATAAAPNDSALLSAAQRLVTASGNGGDLEDRG